MLMGITFCGSNVIHKASASDIQNLYDTISSAYKYTVRLTYDCSHYSGGYTAQGYIGCVSIIKNT